jgi:hypothetical protein
MSTVSPHDDSEVESDPDAELESRGARRRRQRRDESRPSDDDLPQQLEALIGETTDIEIDLTADPPRVVAKASSPPAQVFEGAAVYRPVLVSLVVAAAIVVGYGVVVLASVLFDGVSPDTSPFESARPDRTVVASRGSFAAPGRCTEVSGRVFVDGDGNAIADPWDPEHDYDGIEVVVETDAGLSHRVPVGSDGSWSLRLDAPAAASVAVTDLANLADAGLWPGPRLLSEAGEAPIIGETCSLELGLIWKPEGATAPLVGPVGGIAPDDVPSADAAAAATGWRAGIQVHGRVWLDSDGDGHHAPSEQGVAGATIELYREDGSLAATAVTGTDGTYAVSNLRPTAAYTVVVAADEPVTAVRAMGEGIETDEPSRVEIRTSATGMSVWGLDFGVGGPEVTTASEGAPDGDPDGGRDRVGAGRRNRGGGS